MRKANIYVNEELAGILTENDNGSYTFSYTDQYFNNPEKSAISLTFPKSQKEYHSESLFPFFFNMLSEGVNKQVQVQKYKIDENDFFSLLLETAHEDTIGAVTVKPIKDEKAD
ncbi:phosphatidylinositol kinase [Bacteroidia bacterium]|nr:phosphatidylinositol kinase [Bacteroidia bacterium]GHV41082.1 phosphatidylinositol kinase [Bacteroidia bacterium]